MELRARWGLGTSPIRQIVPLLELHGVRVFSLAEDTLSVDAYSVWRGRYSIYLPEHTEVRRAQQDGRRSRAWDTWYFTPGAARSETDRLEREAQQFGASFLMPRASVTEIARQGYDPWGDHQGKASLDSVGRRPHLQAARAWLC